MRVRVDILIRIVAGMALKPFRFFAVYVSSQRQLALIRHMHELLERVGIDHWLHGGWAIDFRLGAVTRPHGDIDMLIWGKDANRVRRTLRAQGYRVEDDSRYPDETFHVYKGDEHISFTFLERNGLGQIITPGRWGPWPEGTFSATIVALKGVVCPTVSAEAMLDIKENQPKHPAGRPLAEHDRADIVRLRRLLSR